MLVPIASPETPNVKVAVEHQNKLSTEDEKSFHLLLGKKYKIEPKDINVLETKFHADAGNWYVALGWEKKRVVVQMDSVLKRDRN